jgi:hypothetical protein
MEKFRAEIEIIGVNPFIFVPGKVLTSIFHQAGKDKGYIASTTISSEPGTEI